MIGMGGGITGFDGMDGMGGLANAFGYKDYGDDPNNPFGRGNRDRNRAWSDQPGLTGLETAFLITQGVGTAASIYGGIKEGQRRAEEEEERRRQSRAGGRLFGRALRDHTRG